MTAKPIWTIAKVLDWTKQYFAEKGLENPRLDAEILLCSVLKCQRITLYVHFDQPLEEHELAQYRGYVARRAAACARRDIRIVRRIPQAKSTSKRPLRRRQIRKTRNL